MQICPNGKFIEIFAQRYHYFEDPFYKSFALNLLFQDTSYSLTLKYSSFLFKFFSFAFYNIKFWFKIGKICSKISLSRGNTDQWRNKGGRGEAAAPGCRPRGHPWLLFNFFLIKKWMDHIGARKVVSNFATH